MRGLRRGPIAVVWCLLVPAAYTQEGVPIASASASRAVVDRYCVAGTPDECVARVRDYLDAGARHVVFNLAEPEDAERLAEVARAAAG